MGMDPVTIAAIAAVAVPALIGAGKMLFPPDGASSGDVTAAGAKKMADMQKAASAYGAYRPDMADARMKAMTQQLSAYQGAGNMMQAMYGGGGGPAGGTVTPGAGGYKKPTDGYSLPDGTRTPIDPRTGGPVPGPEMPTWRPDYSPKPWDPQTSPPIYVPRDVPNGTGAGSSGTSFTGPLPPNPMVTSLAMGDAPPLTSNPMASALARKPVV